jgi:hypothetical protein
MRGARIAAATVPPPIRLSFYAACDRPATCSPPHRSRRRESDDQNSNAYNSNNDEINDEEIDYNSKFAI